MGDAATSTAREKTPLRVQGTTTYDAVASSSPPASPVPMGGGAAVAPAPTAQRNPFVYDSPMNSYEKCKIIVMCLLGVPLLRVLLLAVIVLLAVIICNLALLGYSSKAHAVIPLWRRWFAGFVTPLLARASLFILGYYWIPVTYPAPTGGKSSLRRQRIVVSNHITFVDGVFLYYLMRPSIAMKAEVARIPLVGKVIQMTQPILIDRSTSEGRQRAKQEISDRVAETGAPSLLIFPEGTTSNQKFLTKFKVGSFASGAPCQPIVLRYPFRHFDVSWTPTVSATHLVLRMLCQVYNRMEVRVLPPYFPSQTEQQSPEIYADSVRRVMAAALGDVHCTNHAFEDVAMLMQVGDYATRHVVPLTDVGEIATLTSLRSADVNKLVTYFSRHDLDKDGLLSLEELQHLLPADDPALVEQLFYLVDVDGSGQIDFRELCLALKSLNPAFSDEDLTRFAFRLYDLDDNGVIDAAELERMLSFAGTFYGVSAPDALENAVAEMTHGAEHVEISFEQFQRLIEQAPELLGHTRSRLELLRGSLRED